MSVVDWLRLPEARRLGSLDGLEATRLHRRIIRAKPFLERLYIDFYTHLSEALGKAGRAGTVVELGSGGGFIKEILPHVITSDVQVLPDVDRVFSATELPFPPASLDGVVLVDVLHHIADPAKMFGELDRCLKVGGRIVMIEPALTLWGRFVYKHLCHESYDPGADWRLPSGGPMSVANTALPWIVLCRDRERFERMFPSLKVTKLTVHTPMRYLLSGGLSMRQFVPTWTYPLVRAVEAAFSPLAKWTGMFMTVRVDKLS